jgi:hypothetical protein
LELRRAIYGTANREEQMVIFTEINHRAEVKRGADILATTIILLSRLYENVPLRTR